MHQQYFYGISNRVNITRDGAQPEPVSNAQDAVSPKAQETVLVGATKSPTI